MHTVIVVVHLILAATLIGLVLIQRGKGADMGAAFGSGASTTVFGSQGSASFLTRGTAIVAALFFLTSLALAYTAAHRGSVKSVTEQSVPVQTAPATTGDVPSVPKDVPAAPK